MPIIISPARENDVRTIVRVELAAFESHPRTPMMWRHGYTAELYAFVEAAKTQSFHEDSEARFVNAVDETTGVIVGASQWKFALDAAANAHIPAPDPDAQPPPDWPPGGNWEMRLWYKINLHKILVKSFEGKPYILLETLTVNPESHRQGIGAKLLEWGVRQADDLGVLMGLESTPTGLALYKRFGFRETRVIKADMKAFGWDQPYDEEAAKRVWMVREPQSRT